MIVLPSWFTHTLPEKEKGSGKTPNPQYECVNETRGCF